MKHLFAIGACYLDTILTVQHYPSEDEKLRASSLVQRRGGNCPNTFEVLQQLLDLDERPAIFLVLSSVLPSLSSTKSLQIKSSFSPKVDLKSCIHREDYSEPASSYIIRSSATGSRTLINYNELPEMTYEEFVPIADKRGTEVEWCHFEGRIPEVALKCMRYLRQRSPNVIISVEVEKPGRAGLEALAAEANVVFYSKSWAQTNGYESPEDCLQAQAMLTPNAFLLSCTWGEGGASVLEVATSVYRHSAAWIGEEEEVIDTVGAGDTFIAGMLYGLICHSDDWALERKLDFANELAGRKVVQEGLSGLGSSMQHSL